LEGWTHPQAERARYSRKIYQVIRHFLAGRKTRVEVNGTRSNQFLMKQGLPQGSSISPILFVVFINDIDVDLDPRPASSRTTQQHG
jgi:retron-type reverse transcriptase